MTGSTVKVFVNARALDVSAGATVLDAVRAWDPQAATEVERGERLVLDDRGLAIDSQAPVHGGSILRLTVPRRLGG
jgi:hypothetical protein